MQPENVQVQVLKGGPKLGPHLHPHNLGWKAVEGELLTVQCDIDDATKALLKVVRKWDMTLCAIPVAKRGWIVPLAAASVEAFVVISMTT